MSIVEDQYVSPRYHLGELRLSRLNLVAPIRFKRAAYYTIPEPRRPINWPHFFIGLFALFSVIIGAMQVVLAVEAISPRYNTVKEVFRWSSIIFLVLFCIGFLAILMMTAYSLVFFVREWFTAEKSTRRMPSHV
jgi:hypothetical protein